MWTLSIRSKIFLLNIIFVDISIVTDAFCSRISQRSSRIRLLQRITTSNVLKLWFDRQPEDSGPDFHTPVQSFSYKRRATVTSDLTSVSYLDVVSDSTANDSLISGVADDVLYHSSIPVTDIDDTKQPSSPSSSSPFISDKPITQARLIQQAYRQWVEFYGKIPNKDRLGIFSLNFLAVQEYHEKTGRPLVLNEFADQTEEEYKQDKQPSTDNNKLIKSSETYIVDDHIRGAYREWCEYYGISYDEKCLKTFASNFVAVEKYHRQTKKSLALNEFAGMTESEYERHLATDAHFVPSTEQNIVHGNNSYRTNDDHNSNSFLQDSTETEPNNNDPITAYLDPNPIGYSRVDKMQPPNIQSPIPNSQTQLVHNSNNVSNRDTSESSSINGVLSALLSTVSSLSTVAQSLTTGSSLSIPPSTERSEPLDSFVMDVLEQQDGSITQLEDSVEGLREIQVQSSDLIQLVSQNQMQMTEMMAAVQSEVASLRLDQEQFEGKKSLLMKRIDDLEARIAEYESIGPSSRRTRTLETRSRKIVQIKPNLPAMGERISMLNWDNSPEIVSRKTEK